MQYSGENKNLRSSCNEFTRYALAIKSVLRSLQEDEKKMKTSKFKLPLLMSNLVILVEN